MQALFIFSDGRVSIVEMEDKVAPKTVRLRDVKKTMALRGENRDELRISTGPRLFINATFKLVPSYQKRLIVMYEEQVGVRA